MQPKIHRHVLCAKNVITIQGHKTGGGGCFAPPSEITDKTTPLFYILGSSVIRYWCTKHACMVLGCIAFFNRGVDAS